jgi:hypothetical protein
MTNNRSIQSLADRWNSILRMKAAEYEHEARKRGEEVASPDIDDICNEMNAYFTGVINDK